jgi:RNA polymerase sigma-70 factor (ECF subfamily)
MTGQQEEAAVNPDADELRRLVARVAAQDQAAFNELVRRTSGFVAARCTAVIRNRELADDATQRVYVKVWQQADRFDVERGSVIAWLSVISRNTSVDLVRVEERAGRKMQRAAQHMTTTSHVLDDHGNALADRGALAAALAQLPEDQRRPIELAYFNDLSYQQVAAELGQPEGTIKSRIRRGMLRLADLLGEER